MTEFDVELSPDLVLSGYQPTSSFPAIRYKRGTRTIFTMAIPLYLVPTFLPKPDPDQPFEDNRAVNPLHAQRFAKYWRERPDWTCPPVLLDTSRPLDFKVIGPEGEPAQFVVLQLPHAARLGEILDGQHRILGWYMAVERIENELRTARESLIGSKRAQDPVGIEFHTAQIDDLQQIERRLRTELVTLEIVAGVTKDEHKQAFVDITNNALGIKKSKTVEFDSSSILNRVARHISEAHPLLHNRVDFEKDRMMGANPNFLSARNVADIVRHVCIGISGRMNDRREADWRDADVAKVALTFFDVLVDEFPDIEKVADGTTDPDELRTRSLLASATILRVLAGTFHNLAVTLKDDVPEVDPEALELFVRPLFADLAPHMGAPVSAPSPWFDTEVFDPTVDGGVMAPGSRAQELSHLTATLTAWGKDEEKFPFARP